MFSTSDLEAYLDEALPSEEMARIEKAVREDEALGQRLASIHSRRGAGVHTVGEIWRGRRLSCPTREQLGSWLLGAMDEESASYIGFHIEVIGCRYCQANVADLRIQQEGDQAAVARRHKYFQSSAGYLTGRDEAERPQGRSR
jgi:hypothetical protein